MSGYDSYSKFWDLITYFKCFKGGIIIPHSHLIICKSSNWMQNSESNLDFCLDADLDDVHLKGGIRL